MITDDQVWGAFKVMMEEAECWRVVNFKHNPNCWAIREEPAKIPTLVGIHDAAPCDAVQERYPFANQQLAGEFIQWKMLEAALKHHEQNRGETPVGDQS